KHLSARPEALEPDQAVALLHAGLELARDAGVQELPSREMRADIISEQDIPLLQAFMQAGDPFCSLSDNMSDPARARRGEAGWDAFFFLREPLYRLRSAYQVADWVLWPLCSKPGDVDLMEARYRLIQGGWSPGWTGERLFIFDRREELGLR